MSGKGDKSERDMDAIYWSTLRDIPRKCKWPVKVCDWGDGEDKVQVFCHSDNAYFEVGRMQLEPFEKHNMKKFQEKGIAALKNRKHTIAEFLLDIEWAKEEVKNVATRQEPAVSKHNRNAASELPLQAVSKPNHESASELPESDLSNDMEYDSVSEPNHESASELPLHAVSEPNHKSASELSLQAVSEPNHKSASELPLQAVSEPNHKSASDLLLQAVSEPNHKSASELPLQAVSEPNHKSASELPQQAVSEPNHSSASELPLQAVSEPNHKSASELPQQAVSEPNHESALYELLLQAVSEPNHKSASELPLQAVSEPNHKSASELPQQAVSEPNHESALYELLLQAVSEPNLESASELPESDLNDDMEYDSVSEPNHEFASDLPHQAVSEPNHKSASKLPQQTVSEPNHESASEPPESDLSDDMDCDSDYIPDNYNDRCSDSESISSTIPDRKTVHSERDIDDDDAESNASTIHDRNNLEPESDMDVDESNSPTIPTIRDTINLDSESDMDVEHVSDSERSSDDNSGNRNMTLIGLKSSVRKKKPSGHERKVCHDINNKNIYVRKVLKSQYAENGKKKKSPIVWNQAHYCKFCKQTRTNIAKHLKKHRKAHEVKEILELIKKLGPKHKLVKAKWDMLRNASDNLNNKKVLKKGAGEIILGRRHEKSTFCVGQYGPCPGCHIWIKLDKTMRHHQKVCAAVVLGLSECSEKSGKELRILSLCEAGRINEVASKALREEVFTIMKNDDISRAAQKDPLIVSLGNMWLLKNVGNQLKRKYYASQRMRDAARLLMNLQQQTQTDKTLFDFFTPQFFDDIVKAALTTASPDFDDEEDLKSPSTAIKIGYDVKRMVGTKWAMCLKSGDREEVEHCNDILKLMQLEWSMRVTKLAFVTLQTRRFNQIKSLPNPDDLVTLQNHIKAEVKNLQLQPEQASLGTYRRAVELCQTRLLLYNKRRSGELEAMTVKQYLRRQSGVTDVERSMRAHLSELELYLLRNQDVIEIRGKGGRCVPVIVPKDVQPILQFLVNANVRRECGIHPDNIYLFPNTRLGAKRAYDCLKKICRELRLKQPEQITSVNMRKYTATVSQIFDLSTQQQQWLTNHLGHSMDVHKIHYRQTSGVIERVDIAKLMLMQEFNIAGQYAGKKLDSINLSELVFGSESGMLAEMKTTDEIVHSDEAAPLDGCSEDDVQPDLLKVDAYDEYAFQDDDDNGTTKKRKQKSTRVPWTAEELQEVHQYFELTINAGHTPGKTEVEKIRETSRKNGGSLHNRHWEIIKKKVWNIIQKTKL